MSRGTLVPSRYSRLRLRGCHALWPRFPTVFGSAAFACRWPATPGVRRPLVWPLPSSLATTKGIEFSFFSSGYLDVSLPRVPPVKLWIHSTVTEHYLGRVPPFGYPWINAYLRLPMAFRSLSRPSSAISALASTLRSFLLDLLSPLRRLLRPLSGFLAPRFLSRSSFLSFPVQFSRCALALRARPSPARKFRLRLA